MEKQLTQLEPILLVDSHHGIYMMQLFCQDILAGGYFPDGVSKEDIEYLANRENMEDDGYWDAVNDFENNLILSDKYGNKFYIMFNEDLWAIPKDFDTEGWFF